jgi:hypothetical protein
MVDAATAPMNHGIIKAAIKTRESFCVGILGSRKRNTPESDFAISHSPRMARGTENISAQTCWASTYGYRTP